MASPAPPSSDFPDGRRSTRKPLGLVANARKNKHSFIQLFVMTGIMLMSFRSLSQKYIIHDLEEDTAALKEERETLTDRMKHIKSSLLHEASLDSTGVFASRLRLLFGNDNQ